MYFILQYTKFAAIPGGVELIVVLILQPGGTVVNGDDTGGRGVGPLINASILLGSFMNFVL